jgi:hypothetical protein
MFIDFIHYTISSLESTPIAMSLFFFEWDEERQILPTHGPPRIHPPFSKIALFFTVLC